MRNSGRESGANGGARGDQPALDELAQTDLLLNALAARADVGLDDCDDIEDHALALLLGDWRDDLRWPPASALVSQEEAEEALRDGMRDRSTGRRGLAAVGSVAATLLMLSGFGAVVADARPGDLLYGLHAMMFNEPRVSDDQIELSAKADLAKAEQMIAQGQWDQAQNQLNEVSSALQSVNDGSRRQGLLDEVNQLNTKVERHDPKASPPASVPNPEAVAPSGPAANQLTPPLAPSLTPPLAPGLTPTLAPSGRPQPPSAAPAPNQRTSTVAPATPTPSTSAPPVATTPPQTPPQTPPKPTTTVPKSSAATPTPSAAPSPTDTPTTTTKAKHRHRGQTETTETPVAAPSGPATPIPTSAKP